MSFDPSRIFPARLSVLQQLVESYDGSLPFSVYLKSFFRKNRNFGSRDRAFYTAWTYAFFRAGKSVPDLSFRERLAVAGYLQNLDNNFISFLKGDTSLTEFFENTEQRISHITKLYSGFSTESVFPFRKELSHGLTHKAYAKSMLERPKVWIRMLRGKENFIKKELTDKNIPFREDSMLPQAISLDPEVKLEETDSFKKQFFEIQDRSSQLISEKIPASAGKHWWDCCCGSGGKTLGLLDRIPDLRITATDVRMSILENFRQRTNRYKNRVSDFMVDLAQPLPVNFFPQKFDGIVADVPCSGSGTWGRTPESLVHFDENRLSYFIHLQRNIIKNALPFLKENGILVYITCSVFKSENEENTEWIQAQTGLTLKESALINGMSTNSDSMFYAIFHF